MMNILTKELDGELPPVGFTMSFALGRHRLERSSPHVPRQIGYDARHH